MAESLVSVRNLRHEFRSGFAGRRRVVAVDGVSFDIERGTTLGLVGESGSGKSTTGRLLVRLLKPTSGTITVKGTEVSSLHARQLSWLRATCSMVFQDPFSSLDPTWTVEHCIAEPLEQQAGLSGPDRWARVAELLERVRLPVEVRHQRPRVLSGGQCQRVAIARALATRPELIILDEATSALDVSVQAQILRLLVELQDDYGLTFLLITHDLDILRLMAHHAVVMRHGSVVESGSTGDILGSPRHPYTQKLVRVMLNPLEQDDAGCEA